MRKTLVAIPARLKATRLPDKPLADIWGTPMIVHVWRQAMAARGPRYNFFEHLRTVTSYVVFEGWDHLLRSIEAAAVRPP